MGQYRPSGLIPSTLTSTYTIDATVANDFRCRINGTSPTTKYQLKIMKNDATSALVYDSGVVTLSTPLYPVSYNGTQNELVVNVPSTSGMANGNEYKWTMTSYWSNTDKYESYENVFKAYANASVSITNLPTVLSEREYTFVASCTQAQGVAVERFGWIIRNKDTKEEAVNTIDGNNIYSSDIRVTYNGFLSGTTEEIKVKCWLNDGTSVETEFQQFAVEYRLIALENNVVASAQSDGGVSVEWTKLSYIVGSTTNNDYEYLQDLYGAYKGKYAHFNAGNTVTFNEVNTVPMAFPSSVSHVVGFGVTGPNNSIYKATGVDSNGSPYQITLKSTSTQFMLDVNGATTTLFPVVEDQYWVTVFIEPKRVRAIQWIKDAPLYPAEDLYPSNTLYPRSGVGPVELAEVYVDIDDGGTWNSISMSGDVFARYIWIKNSPITDDEYLNLKDVNTVPSWGDDTLILALFNGNLLAGSLQSEVALTGWLVYSIESGSSFLKPVMTAGAFVSEFVDYTPRNTIGIVYYVFPVFGDKIGASASSNLVTPDWWDWFLIVCDEVDNDVYTHSATYRFDLDVSSGNMTNNTSFTELQNFTKYAKIQNSPSNYWTGTLSAFIGNCANTYSDTVERMNELKGLTTDGKDKFLKDRKGNIWKVRLNSAVTEQIVDEYVEQAVVITLGWMEIGSADDSVITSKV